MKEEKLIPVVNMKQHDCISELYLTDNNDCLIVKDKENVEITRIKKTSALMSAIKKIEEDGNYYGVYLANKYVAESFYKPVKGKTPDKKDIRLFSFDNDVTSIFVDKVKVCADKPYIALNEVICSGKKITVKETFFALNGSAIAATKYEGFNEH